MASFSAYFLLTKPFLYRYDVVNTLDTSPRLAIKKYHDLKQYDLNLNIPASKDRNKVAEILKKHLQQVTLISFEYLKGKLSK